MTRISISIPDKLMARLEPIKDDINVSQLCREALEQRVAAYERAAQRNGKELDLEGLVQRLKQERALVGAQFEQLAQSTANAWLGEASYLDIKTAAKHDYANMSKYKLPPAAFRMMKQDMEEAKVSCEGVHAVLYKTAWLDSVKGVWSEVAARLEDSTAVEAAATAD